MAYPGRKVSETSMGARARGYSKSVSLLLKKSQDGASPFPFATSPSGPVPTTTDRCRPKSVSRTRSDTGSIIVTDTDNSGSLSSPRRKFSEGSTGAHTGGYSKSMSSGFGQSLNAQSGNVTSLSPGSRQQMALSVPSDVSSERPTSASLLVPGAGRPSSSSGRLNGRMSASPEPWDINIRQTMAILHGDLSELPPVPSSVIRVFLSSTFKDMTLERNTLTRDVFPHLKQYSSKLGFDFQVADMRWGVGDDATNEHTTERLCQEEILKCQRISAGPNFVALVGNRYGYRPFPVEIPIKEFDVIMSMAEERDILERHLLTEWFLADYNALPPVYVLQPINSKIPHFGNTDPEQEKLAKEAHAKWVKIFTTLQHILRHAVDHAVKKKLISEERRNNYFVSVTAGEIERGIFKAKEVNRRSLCYAREIPNIDKFQFGAQDPSTRIYVDTRRHGDKVVVDHEAVSLLQDLKRKLRKKLKIKYSSQTVVWFPRGIDPNTQLNHAEYIDKLTKQITADMEGLINVAHQEKTNNEKTAYWKLRSEVLYHHHIYMAHTGTFCGRERVLEKIRDLILSPQFRRPIVLHGESGYGKTAVMTQLVQTIPEWLSAPVCLKVIRFVGASLGTSTVYGLLSSVYYQIDAAFKMLHSPEFFANTKRLIRNGPLFLRNCARKHNQPIVVILDALNQLHPAENAYEMQWLPGVMTELPLNVHLIVSSNYKHDIVKTLQKLRGDDKGFIQLGWISQATADDILEANLKHYKRTLTEQQKGCVLEHFAQGETRTPLFLKLLIEEALMWRSYTELCTIQSSMSTTVQASINRQFDQLEAKFKKIIVQNILGYITIGLNGVTENELEDVLSCDNEVLKEAYVYHKPPASDFIRMPPLIWARLRHEMRDFLEERQSHGLVTIDWCHQQFRDAAYRRYVGESDMRRLHKNMAEIVSTEQPIVKSLRIRLRNERKVIVLPDVDRKVTLQPLSRTNFRKLDCWPHHLLNAGDIDGLKRHCWFNLEFLMMALDVLGIASVIDALQAAVDQTSDEELQNAFDAVNCASERIGNVSLFPFYLLAAFTGGKPNSEGKPSLESQFIQQLRNWIKESKTLMLEPLHPFLFLHEMREVNQQLNAISEIKRTKSEASLNQSSSLCIRDLQAFDVTSNGSLLALGYISSPLQVVDLTTGVKVDDMPRRHVVDGVHFVCNDSHLFVFQRNVCVYLLSLEGDSMQDNPVYDFDFDNGELPETYCLVKSSTEAVFCTVNNGICKQLKSWNMATKQKEWEIDIQEERMPSPFSIYSNGTQVIFQIQSDLDLVQDVDESLVEFEDLSTSGYESVMEATDYEEETCHPSPSSHTEYTYYMFDRKDPDEVVHTCEVGKEVVQGHSGELLNKFQALVPTSKGICLIDPIEKTSKYVKSIMAKDKGMLAESDTQLSDITKPSCISKVSEKGCFAFGYKSGHILIHTVNDTPSLIVEKLCKPTKAQVKLLALSKNGDLVACWSHDHTLSLWTCQSSINKESSVTLPLTDLEITHLRFSDDGQLLFVVGAFESQTDFTNQLLVFRVHAQVAD
ncbi:NACHT domain- and WD repeat-containing protein 1 isoform X2 [Lingula anatina]|uniref:NACHT domain- and WD repeat-containing protein 1 isoform X2 n=1 Tax=Lingula anatina TaxID=7574 RepID=A0A1S3JSF0_LINAN|nr:NACHT domain- and WD repeat-containing protein 1 isoform X2 [Lingula anatina]|eukprot:XP_013413262.1 NACHT domain- and WD repeat-containing protein 1 isoform X2 [Lingula anatina]